jgi:hypothetical protein
MSFFKRFLGRVKKGMRDRYRLFFRFASSPLKVILYVWFNDEDHLAQGRSKDRHVRNVLTHAGARGSAGEYRALLAESHG